MNDMKLIMESWRGYIAHVDKISDDLQLSTSELDRVYLIKEGKQVGETSTTFLLEQYEKNEINEERLGNLLLESIKYEHDQLINEGVLDVLKKVAGKVGQKVKPVIAAAQFKAREFLYKVVYGTASKILRFISAMGKKVLNYLGNYAKTLVKFKDNPPPPTVAQKLLAKGVKLSKIIGGIFKKIASFLVKIVGTIGKFLGHPVVKNTLLIGCVIITGVYLLAPGAIAGGSMAFLVPFASRRTAIATGKEVGKAALGMGKYKVGSDEDLKEDLLSEQFEVPFTDEVAQMVNYSSPDELGVAMDMIANKIGAADLNQSLVSTTVTNVISVDGEDWVDYRNEVWIGNSDENLKAQYEALASLKAAAAKSGNEVLESFEVTKEFGEKANAIMKSALDAAKNHCLTDKAACLGAKAFIKDIHIANKSLVSSEFVEWAKSDYHEEVRQGITNSQAAGESETGIRTATDTEYSVTRGGEEGEKEFYRTDKSSPEHVKGKGKLQRVSRGAGGEEKVTHTRAAEPKDSETSRRFKRTSRRASKMMNE